MWWITWKLKELRHKLLWWLAWKLPKKIVLFASIRLIAAATTGQYSDTVVSDLTAMDAVKRWENA